jgi:hypothetical protein
MPQLPTKEPSVTSTMPTTAPKAKPISSPTSEATKPTAKTPPAKKTPSCGTRSQENGGMVYETKTGGTMIRVSRILAPKAEAENPNIVPLDIDERRSPFHP